MRSLLGVVSCLVALLFLMRPALADPTCTTLSDAISCIGTLATPENVFVETFDVAGGGADITVQTYGFGGTAPSYTDAAGKTIPAGGFDSLVALFSGPPTAATILTDGGGNPIVSADSLSLFSPGCPPAGTVTVGTVAGVCGDNTLLASLGAGVYTLLLTDTNFVPIPVNPGSSSPFDLTDTSSSNYGSSTGNGAYNDLSGGVFQTCASLTDCNTDNGNFAVDITFSQGAPVSPVPEPGTLTLLGGMLTMLFWKALSLADGTRSGPLENGAQRHT
jgi:hypothetical protein